MLHEGFVLLQEAKIHRAKKCFYHISKIVHPLVDIFHGEFHMDDGKFLKKFYKILVHMFREIGLHHLQPFLMFLNIYASISQDCLCGGA